MAGQKKYPPGPQGGFLGIGNLFAMRRGLLQYLEECVYQYGDILYTSVLGIPICVINSPEWIEQVLVTQREHLIKPLDLRLLKIIFGNGLLTNEGEFWQKQRRLAQPAFHKERIRNYGQIMVAQTDKMLEHWQEGQQLEIQGEMMQVTLKIITETLFSADIDEDTEKVRQILEVTQDRFAQIVANPLSVFLPTPDTFRTLRAIRALRKIIYGIIQRRREGQTSGDDLLSMLLHAQDEDGSRMDDQQLYSEVVTLFLAGHETTALAMTWALYLIAQHPRIEDKIVAELESVLAGRLPSAEDYGQLEYIRTVLKETMRLYPPAWGIGREVTREIEIDGYTIPKRTQIYLLEYVLHRDPRYYEKPQQFYPERWTPEFEKQLPKYAYFPFGGGPRFCIGSTFAMMEATLMLATILQRFRLELVSNEPVGVQPAVTLRPKDDIFATVQKRKRSSMHPHPQGKALG